MQHFTSAVGGDKGCWSPQKKVFKIQNYDPSYIMLQVNIGFSKIQGNFNNSFRNNNYFKAILILIVSCKKFKLILKVAMTIDWISCSA